MDLPEQAGLDRPAPHAQRGITLTELMVAVALMGMLVGLIGFIFIQARRTMSATSSRVETFSRIRDIFERLERDINRMARTPLPELEQPSSANPTSNWALTVTPTTYAPEASVEREARADELAFMVWMPFDDEVRPAYVRYRLAGTDRRFPRLVREVTILDDDFDEAGGVDQPRPETVLAKVRSLEFAWFAQSGEGVGMYWPPGGPSLDSTYEAPPGEEESTTDGSAFFVGGEGDILSDDDFEPRVRARRLLRLHRGDLLHLRSQDEERPRPFRVKRIDRSVPVIELVEHVEPEEDVEFLAHLYPPSFRIRIRTMDAEGISPEVATKIIELPR